MAPRRFGKYEVLARLATGGAANIFLARQPGAAGFHKLVCLKTLLPERASDQDFVAMFLDEARLAARLTHPNCVQIYDLGRVRGSYYISMEYIFGETLWNVLSTVAKLRTALPINHVASIIASVCDGLHHAHELKDSNGKPFNLVHRDVSPQNVMISFEGQTKVVDFGIAKAETGRVPTMAGIVKGKFSYMSPEQITGGAIDRRSDVFSVGIVLFECLASRRLYRGDSPEDIAKLILDHRAPRLRELIPEIPVELEEICATALQRQPGKRYQTAHEMGGALRDYLDGVRYAQSTGAIAKLLDERFTGQLAERRKVFESALGGDYDESHLLKVLDARAVRDIDLFTESNQEETGADFIEGAATKELIDPIPAPNMMYAEDPPSRHEGIGFRVEIAVADQKTHDQGSIEASSASDMAEPSVAEEDDDATRVDKHIHRLLEDGGLRRSSGDTLDLESSASDSSMPPELSTVLTDLSERASDSTAEERRGQVPSPVVVRSPREHADPEEYARGEIDEKVSGMFEVSVASATPAVAVREASSSANRSGIGISALIGMLLLGMAIGLAAGAFAARAYYVGGWRLEIPYSDTN
jgi:serine/threonine protein kinase